MSYWDADPELILKSKVTVSLIPFITNDFNSRIFAFLPQVFNKSTIAGTLRCYGYGFEGSHLHHVQLSFEIGQKSDSARLLLYSRLEFSKTRN